jgi:hypothetical protein
MGGGLGRFGDASGSVSLPLRKATVASTLMVDDVEWRFCKEKEVE